MIEADILKSVINEDNELAYFIWKNNKDEVSKIITTTRLKDHFLRLIGPEDSSPDENIDIYLKERKFKNRVKENFVKKLSAELRSHDIQHILFKGLVISKLYYEHYTDRTYYDFDILVKRESYEKLYKYLNKKNYPHLNNYKYLDRMGFCRNALEVINTDYGALDIHHRITSKFYEKNCKLTNDAFLDVKTTEDINHASDEINLCIVLHHAYKQNGLKLDPYYLVDFDKIYKSDNLDRKQLSIYLKNYDLNEAFNHCFDILKQLNMNNKVPKDIFKWQYKSNFFLNNYGIRRQLNQLIDPLPYMRITTGSEKFTYTSFLKIKSNKLLKELGVK